MGVYGDGDNGKKGKSRGKANVARSLAGLGQAPGRSGDADWRQADFSWLAGIIIEATRRGGMAAFGLSRDRGAYQVSIWMDGEKAVVWIGQGEDLNAKLEEIVHYLASLPD